MIFLNLETLTVELGDQVSGKLPFLDHFENFAKIPYSFLWKETTHLALFHAHIQNNTLSAPEVSFIF